MTRRTADCKHPFCKNCKSCPPGKLTQDARFPPKPSWSTFAHFVRLLLAALYILYTILTIHKRFPEVARQLLPQQIKSTCLQVVLAAVLESGMALEHAAVPLRHRAQVEKHKLDMSCRGSAFGALGFEVTMKLSSLRRCESTARRCALLRSGFEAPARPLGRT